MTSSQVDYSITGSRSLSLTTCRKSEVKSETS